MVDASACVIKFRSLWKLTECLLVPVQGTSVTSDPDPPVIFEREPLVLRCSVSRGTHLSFMWYHNRQEVTSSSSELYRLSESTLTVDRAGEQHAGTYSCTAQNQMDDDTRYSSSRNLEVVVKSKNSSLQRHVHVLCQSKQTSRDERKSACEWLT